MFDHKPAKRSYAVKDFTGSVFNGVIVLSEAQPRSAPSGKQKRFVVAKCLCGKIFEVKLDSLKTGNTRSCGCLHQQVITKHGMEGSKTYDAWKGAVSRGTGKSKVKDYYGRGIRICDSWKESFVNFLNDMGKRPDGMSLDRIDNDGNYEPSNCRWATLEIQAQNKRNNKLIEYKGETLCLSAMARKYGFKPSTIGLRLRDGWSVSEALETPTSTKFLKK